VQAKIMPALPRCQRIVGARNGCERRARIQFALLPRACATHLFRMLVEYSGISLNVSPMPCFGTKRATVACVSSVYVSVQISSITFVPSGNGLASST
jgi:hypothetical protein